MRPNLLIVLSLAASLFLPAAGVRARQDEQSTTGAPPVFDFHSGFWVNLHHFLYLQGRIRNAENVTTEGLPTPPKFSEPASTVGMTAAEAKAWENAVSIYAAEWSGRDLENNRDMALINNRLAEMEPCSDLSGKEGPECAAGVRPELVTALNEAAAIYRARWWAEQDKENRAWIAEVAPMVRQAGEEVARRLAEIYGSDWPGAPIHVDVVWYAGPSGAYVTLDPPHVTISSGDRRDRGSAGFEVLFDEASHTLAGGIREEIVEQCRKRKQPIPRDLWHAIVFYTTGETVQEVLAKTGAGAKPNGTGLRAAAADVQDELSKHGWGGYLGFLQLYWQPYLDGREDLETSVARLIPAL